LVSMIARFTLKTDESIHNYLIIKGVSSPKTFATVNWANVF